MTKITDETDVRVPVKTLRILPAILFNAMGFVRPPEKEKDRIDAAQRQRLLEQIDTVRNEILKLLGYRVSPD